MFPNLRLFNDCLFVPFLNERKTRSWPFPRRGGDSPRSALSAWPSPRREPGGEVMFRGGKKKKKSIVGTRPARLESTGNPPGKPAAPGAPSVGHPGRGDSAAARGWGTPRHTARHPQGLSKKQIITIITITISIIIIIASKPSVYQGEDSCVKTSV